MHGFPRGVIRTSEFLFPTTPDFVKIGEGDKISEGNKSGEEDIRIERGFFFSNFV